MSSIIPLRRHIFSSAGTDAAWSRSFSGDSHFDYFDSINGVNYFVTQGCGGVGPKELPQQARVYHQLSGQLCWADTFDSKEYCLIDLAAVKTEKREVRLFRLGAGVFYFHRGAKF